jgi:phage baseplate assembly protein W
MTITRADKITETLFVQQTYSDFTNDLTVHPITQQLVVLKNADAVKQSLRNLVLTNLGEKPFNPLFGSNVNKSLFELFDLFFVEDIKRYIALAVQQYEPRVNLISVEVIPGSNENGATINIVFSLINTTQPLSISIYVKRVR